MHIASLSICAPVCSGVCAKIWHSDLGKKEKSGMRRVSTNDIETGPAAHAISKTLVRLLTLSLIIQTFIGMGIVTGLIIASWYIGREIANLNVDAVADIIANVLDTSVNINQLSHDALEAVHGASQAIVQTTTSLTTLNSLLKHPSIQLTLPGLEQS